MSYNLYNEDDEFKPPPTPILEIEVIKEGESYSCTECSSDIEIFYIDDKNNKIAFKCQNINEYHEKKVMSIKNFLLKCPKNTYIYSKCSSCNKQQNRINNDEVFKYCVNCRLVFCIKCLYKHNNDNYNDHHIINNNEIKVKCLVHPNNYNCGYCLDCHCHICYECLESREHIIHRKNNLKEIKPTDDEINALLNIIQKYKDLKKSTEKEKSDILFNLEKNYNKEKEDIRKNYENNKKENENKLKVEIETNKKNFLNEINKTKQKFQNDMKLIIEKYKIMENNIQEKFKKNEALYDENYKKKLEETLLNYNSNFNFNNIECNKKIVKYENLEKLNEMIYNTYNKYKENYFNNVNIINILMYYHKNNELKDLKNETLFLRKLSKKETEEKKYLKENNLNININNQKKDKDNNIQNNNFMLEDINNINLDSNNIENQYKYLELLSINELYNQFIIILNLLIYIYLNINVFKKI